MVDRKGESSKDESDTIPSGNSDDANNAQSPDRGDDSRQGLVHQEASAELETEAQPKRDAEHKRESEAAAKKVFQNKSELPIHDASSTGEPAAAMRGKGPAWFALLLAMIGVAGACFLYYELIFKNPDRALIEQISKQEIEVAAVRREITRAIETSERTQTSALQEALSAQRAQLSEVEERITKTLQAALQAAPPAQREWRLAEAEYLLRIANHRILMEQDSSGALTLLLAVDEIVAELDDFSLHVVRARLADEMIALKQVPSDSSQNIYLRLEALKSEIASLHPVLPEYQQTIGVPEAALTVWEQIAAATKDLVRVRTLEEGATARPLIAPEEEAFLHQHLQLALAQAQLAALKRQQAVYELALTRVREYLISYMDLQAREALLAELDALSLLALERTLPDISGSLNELLSTMGNR